MVTPDDIHFTNVVVTMLNWNNDLEGTLKLCREALDPARLAWALAYLYVQMVRVNRDEDDEF